MKLRFLIAQPRAICKVDCYISFHITGDIGYLLGGKFRHQSLVLGAPKVVHSGNAPSIVTPQVPDSWLINPADLTFPMPLPYVDVTLYRPVPVEKGSVSLRLGYRLGCLSYIDTVLSSHAFIRQLNNLTLSTYFNWL